MVITQYDIVLVNLDPTIGSEINKTRPCVVISPNEMNAHLSTIVIVPLTSVIRTYPTRVNVSLNSKKGQMVVDQIRTIDRQRIVKTLSSLTLSERKNLKAVIKEAYVD